MGDADAQVSDTRAYYRKILVRGGFDRRPFRTGARRMIVIARRDR
jgi:hypothetical protein